MFVSGSLFISSPQNDIRQEHVMLNPFVFALAKLREASRSLNQGLVLS